MAAPPVPASKMLNTYIKDKIAPILIGAGFKATGRVYRRLAGDALQVIDIQNWKHNDSKRARFTIEVGVCFPRLLAAVAELSSYAFYKDTVDKPGITECAVRRRLGEFLEPKQDVWWTVSATTGYVPPVEDVNGPLQMSALPWLQAMSTMHALASARAEHHALTNRVMDVASMFTLGQTALASEAAASLAKARHPTQPSLERGLLDELLSLKKLTSSPPSEA
jgi:Domain of unknown function (DUF4304)